MNPIAVIMSVFAVVGALDRIFGNKFGLGREFERGLSTLSSMALSMIGMIVLAPYIAEVLDPFFSFVGKHLPIDPSIIPATLFANDMGGAPLATELAQNEEIGRFNALVVSAIMGCTISFTIPYALEITDKKQQRELVLGLLCGIVTIPVGCFLGGLVAGVSILPLLINLLPLTLFSALLAVGLVKIPEVCVRIFKVIGTGIKILITIGLTLGIVKFLTGFSPLKGIGTFEEGAYICFNAAAVMAGAFPMVALLSRLLKRPLAKAGGLIAINEDSTMGIFSNFASTFVTFDLIRNMNKKGVVLNAAYLVSAGCFSGHLAFTLAYDAGMIPAVIVAKLTGGVLAFLLALPLYKRFQKSDVTPETDAENKENDATEATV